MLLYLAGEENGLKGGNTYFLDDYRNRIASVTPKAGRVCFFRHGERSANTKGGNIRRKENCAEKPTCLNQWTVEE